MQHLKNKIIISGLVENKVSKTHFYNRPLRKNNCTLFIRGLAGFWWSWAKFRKLKHFQSMLVLVPMCFFTFCYKPNNI